MKDKYDRHLKDKMCEKDKPARATTTLFGVVVLGLWSCVHHRCTITCAVLNFVSDQAVSDPLFSRK